MTTVEKLLVQIFERKNGIIDQVKQQTELYNQHLASQLLIDGITPPSWLWSPNPNATYSKELNKEELISKLLRPYAKPSVCCSIAPHPLYNNIHVSRDNGKLSDGFFMQNLAFHNAITRQEDPAVSTTRKENHAGCAPSSVLQEDGGVTSPEDQTDRRILNMYNAPDQSLARIQRSKSRQRALELRNSANTRAKCCSGHVNNNGFFPSRIRLSMSESEQVRLKEELPMAETCDTGNQNSNGLNAEAHGQSKEKEMDIYRGRITRSRLGQTSERGREDMQSHVSKSRKRDSLLIFDSNQGYATKSVRSTSAVCSQSCEGRKLDSGEACSQSKEKEMEVYNVRITRSRRANQLAEGSLKSGQTSERCREDIPSHVSPARKTGSSLIFCSKQGDADQLLRSVSAVDSQCWQSQKLDGVDFLCKDNMSHVYCGKISGEKVSHDSLTADSDNKRKHLSATDSGDGLSHHNDNGSLLSVRLNSINEGRSHGENDGVVSWSCNDTYDSVVPFCSPKADGVILAQSNGESSLLVNDSNERLELITPSVPVVNKVRVSPIPCNHQETSNPANISEYNRVADTMPLSSCKQNSATNDEIQSASRGQIIISCDEAHNELSLHSLVGQSACSSPKDAKTKKLESFEEYPPSDCIGLLERKQSNFDEIKHHGLRTFVSNSGKRRLDKSPDKNYSSLSPTTSLDKGTSCCDAHISLDEQSPEKSEISSKQEKIQRDAFEFDTQADPGSCAEKHGPMLSKSSENNRDDGNICEHYRAQNEEDILQRKRVDVPDLQIYPLVHHAEQMYESLPERQIDEGVSNQESKDMNPLVSDAPQRKKVSPSCSLDSVTEPTEKCRIFSTEKMHIENPTSVVLDELKQLSSEELQILSCLGSNFSGEDACSPIAHGEDFPLKRRFKSPNMESWPQPKRRKIDHEQTKSPTTFPSFRVGKLQSIQRVPVVANLKNMEIEDAAMMGMGNDLGTLQEMGYTLMERIESSTGARAEEDQFCYKQRDEHYDSSSPINIDLLGVSSCSSLTKKKPNPEQKTDNLYSEVLTGSNRMLQTGQPQPQHHVLPSISKDLEYIDVDESMPVFEGFTIDTEAETAGLEFTADGIDFDRLALPRTTLERASMLAEICRSASMDTPLSHISSSFEFQGNQNLFQSVPKGLIERLDLSTLPLECCVDKQLRSGNVVTDDMKGNFEKISYTDVGPYPGSRYGWSARNQLSPPVGKLWERLSSHAGSSEKRSSSNPELTCFPIEEDPSISEENKPEDESRNNDPEDIDSSLVHCSNKRQPLKDLTNLVLDPPLSIPNKKEALDADDFAREMSSETGAQDKVRPCPKSQYKNKTDRREKQTSYIGPTEERKSQNLSIDFNGYKNGNESINNSMKRTMLPGKNLKRQVRQLSFKESNSSNIVSNVSSFIPLVQQKQTAAACAGKRDVKVKALEAAEAAKRLEEKKANERKMKKEALKVERAKLEEKHLRLVELEKKKKEEERKKKEADIVARKRLREEEERKEKEKKRMRLEARQRQREREENMRAEKAEKEKQRSKDEKMNQKKEIYKESKMSHNGEILRGDEVALKETETRLMARGSAVNYEECSTSVQFCDAGKAMEIVDKSPHSERLLVQRGKSYEISPYRSDDDDEDEESDGSPTKKYIPIWVSEIAVAQFLASQKEIDPSVVIFPPESFSTTDEVVLPRRLQRKQVAA